MPAEDKQPLEIEEPFGSLDSAEFFNNGSWKEGGVNARINLTIMGFLLFFFNYGVRGNINIAIIAMVNHTALNEELEDSEKIVSLDDGPFLWNRQIQGVILSSFFWGYLATNFIGGHIADQIGSKHILGIGLIVAGVCGMLSPIVCQVGWQLFVCVRVVMGLALGPSWPAMQSMMAGWIPPLERSRIATIIYSGANVGLIFVTVITSPITNAICVDANFYIIGGLAVACGILWELTTFNRPEEHPWISQKELKYIKKCIGDSKNEKTFPVPWKALLSSAPVWALIYAQVTSDWFSYSLQVYIPDYLSKYLKFDLTTVGFYCGLAYIMMVAMAYVYSFVGDWLLTNEFCSRNFERKLLNTWMQVGVAICLFIISFADISANLTVGLLFTGCLFAGAVYGSQFVNHTDLSPNFSGSIYGIANTLCTMTGILSPIINGKILSDSEDKEHWKLVFLIAACLLLSGAAVFLVFGSGNEQPWNNPNYDPEKRKLTERTKPQ